MTSSTISVRPSKKEQVQNRGERRPCYCLRCTWSWFTYQERPKRCPCCRSIKWDQPREKEGMK